MSNDLYASNYTLKTVYIQNQQGCSQNKFSHGKKKEKEKCLYLLKNAKKHTKCKDYIESGVNGIDNSPICPILDKSYINTIPFF